jgi:aminopeptidase-like protein
MNIKELKKEIDFYEIGKQMFGLMSRLYPICRSITGEGFRQTLNMLKEHIPLKINAVPSGTEVFDWVVPKEWNIKDAYVKNSKGKKVIDFKKSNLHVVNYSIPVNRKMSVKGLQEHLFTLPEHPDWIPYRTSYYKESWGFCLSHNDFLKLKEGTYEVVIDSRLEDGYLNYGEYYIKGQNNEEILISTHACHPSLCNDNLSGIVLTTFLAKCISRLTPRYSYRFLFIPGGIGSIIWLFLNEDKVVNIKHGLVVACVGDSASFTYKKTRKGDAEIDQAVINILRSSSEDYKIIDFSPYGYDERNFCSPGFNLPMGSLTRSTHSQFPQYHSSADNLDFIKPECLVESLQKYLSAINVLENNKKYLNIKPKGEVQLGKKGLYGMMGGLQKRPSDEMSLLWVLNMSDGKHSLLDISDRSGLNFDLIRNAADVLCEHKLLKEIL